MGIYKDTNEHVLVICDYFYGYICAAKSGDWEFGIAAKMIEILKEQIGIGLHLTETIKCDHGTQFKSEEFTTEMARLGIKMDFCSAKHPAGNLHAEKCSQMSETSHSTLLH